MPGVYDRIFEDYRVVDGDNRSLEDVLSGHARWLETPGCVFQRNDFLLPGDVRTHGVVKPGLYLSIILEGSGEGGPRDHTHRIHYAENQMTAMAVRAPTRCGGDAPRGAHIRAAGLAFPMSSIVRLAIEREFLDLFRTTDDDVVTVALRAPPRLQAIALEMLSPIVDGQAGELLLGAQATEVLARAIYALRHQIGLEAPIDQKRMRLQATKELIDADLRYPWTIAELARRAGSSRRAFNVRFRAAYGVSAIEYLRTSRLSAAREALLYQNLSVTEAADLVGYGNPANFATAFRKHFGYAPSRCRKQISP
jgi:AraC-like DNA-binding protein